MLPSEHTNTVDFDTARLQRLGYAQKQLPTLQPVSLAQLRQQLSMQLQTSLDAERILTIFRAESQRLVTFDSLSYVQDSTDMSLQLGETASHSTSYHLSHDGEQLGCLTFTRQQRFKEEELAELESLIASLVFPLRNALLYRLAVQSSLRDPLTKTGNRLAMDQSLQREVELAKRNQSPLSVLMLDIDHFKQINDNFGHHTGDEVLKAVAATIKSQLRNVDMVFRYGGEEFLVLLSGTCSEAAAMVGERLRHAVVSMQMPMHCQQLGLSISLGCAALQLGENTSSLLGRVDGALYDAKRAGRNRLRMAG
ncbi:MULTISPECIES: GGDEF domain-containing protein [Pseudomonas]|uniref:GGDEF domain-containing protein n=1 Tax=Pseudomonas TaxID=286 RepID=UPI00300262FF